MLRTAMIGAVLVSVVAVGVGVRLAAFGLAWTPGHGGPDRVGSRWAATAYGSLGPHAVGVRSASIGMSARAGMVWYPTRGPAAMGPVTYTYGLKAFSDSPFALATYEGIAIRDAEADVSGGPYPLVLLSPGFAFGASTYGWLAEHLASHGFVVLAVEHDERLEPSLLWQATVDRPQDIVTALDHVAGGELLTDSSGGLTDVSRVAVVGHSYGGYTALAAAGARIDGAGLRDSCERVEANDPIAFQCDSLVPHLDAMAEAARMGPVPSGLWPGWGDDRVDAAVVLAGDAVMFGVAGLAEITAPVMAIGGTADVDAPYAWGTKLAYDATSSVRKVEIGLEGAAHMIFAGPCESSRRVVSVLGEPFCADPTWARSDAHDLVRHYVTAFLRAELMGEADAAAALGSDAVSVENVHVVTSGY